jgi:hypothetical protein
LTCRLGLVGNRNRIALLGSRAQRVFGDDVEFPLAHVCRGGLPADYTLIIHRQRAGIGRIERRQLERVPPELPVLFLSLFLSSFPSSGSLFRFLLLVARRLALACVRVYISGCSRICWSVALAFVAEGMS